MDNFVTIRLPALGTTLNKDTLRETPTRGEVTPTELTDNVLIARICDGDKDALAVLFRRYAPLVRAVASRILRDTAEADDVVQDVFLKIHRLCRTFDPAKASARFWILQMAYQLAISRRRYLNSRQFYNRVDLEEAARSVPDPRMEGGRYEDSFDGVLGNGSLEHMFAELSENQRQTLRLHLFEGYTFEEIAEKLNQTPGNVKHHYFRGLDKLRRQIFGNGLRGGSAV